MTENTYIVTVEAAPEGSSPEMLARLSKVAAYRLSTLERRDQHYPVAGENFDMLDNLEGKFFWEMTDEEFNNNPPGRVDFEVISVDPVERPATAADIRVHVRMPY